MEFLVIHTAGDFIVRTESKTAAEVAEIAAERWGLDVEAVDIATAEDIAANLGQVTEIDRAI